MAIVKINDDTLQDVVVTNFNTARDLLEEAEGIWGGNFDNLYNNIVTSGYLDSLYEDAESNYHKWKGTINVVASVAAFAACLTNPVGWIAAALAVLGAIFGYKAAKCFKSDPTWYTASKKVFENLLYSCDVGADDNYTRITNLRTKFYNIQLNLEKIKTKINDFNKNGASFEKAADQYDLSLRTGGSDNLTILGVETEIVIDGETITMDTSEAMSAFYTYAYTVTSTMIAADYLERTYGYEIDYLGLVANANAFMADTIKSDLYTAEMINLILPACTPDEKAAYGAASAATGLDESELQAALGDVAALGINPLFAGLVGASFIGKLVDDGSTGGTGSTGGPGTTGGTGSTGGPGTTGGTGSTGGPGPTGGTGGYTPGPGTTASTDPTHGIDISDPVDPGVDLDKDIEVELGVLTPEGEVDYDKLAMEEYQFETGIEEIEKFRLQIMDDVEAMYASGDFTTLTKQLQEFGYGTAEIATILASKSMTVNAFLDGNTRQIIAEKAEAMAKADGVDGFKSSYSTNPTTDELGDNKKPLRSLHLNSDNEDLCKMEDELDTLEADYRTKVDDANKLLDEAQVNKQSVDAIKEKYEKEYGSDTSKWSEDAAKEYDEAIDKYNASAEAANKAIEDADKAKESYQTSRKEFDKACEDYYLSKMIADEESGQTEGGMTVDPSVGGPTDVTTGDTTTNTNDGSVSFNEDGTINIGGTTGNTGTTDGGVTFNPDGSVNFGGTSNGGTTGNTADTSSNAAAASDDAFLAALGLKSNDKGNN